MTIDEANQWFKTACSHNQGAKDQDWIAQVFEDKGTPNWVFRIIYGKKQKAVWRVVSEVELLQPDHICQMADNLVYDLRKRNKATDNPPQEIPGLPPFNERDREHSF